MLAQKIIRSSLALLVFTSVNLAQAYLVPGDSHGIGPAPVSGGLIPGGPSVGQGGWQVPPPCDNPYDPSCVQPPPPPPPPPVQPPPGQNYETKQIYFNRTVGNQRLLLRQLAGLGTRYAGYQVMAVRADVRVMGPGLVTAQLSLNGRQAATAVSPSYRIDLLPRMQVILSSSVQDLSLDISGQLYVGTIVLELRRSGGVVPPPPPVQPPPGYSERVDLNIYRSVAGSDRIDLTNYIDMYRYNGRRVVQILVAGRADYNVALVDVLANGFNVGTLQFDRQPAQAVLNLAQPLVIGQSASSLVLYTRGNMTVQTVTLVLSRY